MRKILFIILTLLLSSLSYGQGKTLITFGKANAPSGWTLISETLASTIYNISIKTTADDGYFEINSPTGLGWKIVYNDDNGGASYYVIGSVDAGGDFTLDASGDTVNIPSIVNVDELNSAGEVTGTNLVYDESWADWNGIIFDGGDDRFITPDDADLDFGTGDFSIECLVKFDVLDSYFGIVTKYQNGTNYWEISKLGSNAIRMRSRAGGSNLIDAITSDIIEIDTWYHIVGVSDRDVSNYVYVKSVPVTLGGNVTDDNVNDFNNTGSVYVGSLGAGSFLDGNIIYSRIYNKALSQAEVLDLYNQGLGVKELPYYMRDASQTEFFTTEEDRTLTAGTSDWTNAGYATFDKTGDLSLTADAVGDYAYITFANIGTDLVKDKEYRLVYDYAETVAGFEFKLTGATGQTLGDAVVGSGQTIEFTAVEDYATTDQLQIMAKTSAVAEGNVDNFSIVQIGNVFDGVLNADIVKDLSANANDGVSSGSPVDGKTVVYFPNGIEVPDYPDYAGLSCNDVGATTIDYTDVWEKFILFATDAPEKISDAANATDDITVGGSADYSIHFNGSASVGAATKEFELSVFEIHAASIGAGIASNTEANPIVITTNSAHGLTGGELIKISGVNNATELNDHIYLVKAGASGSTLSLTDFSPTDINSTGYGVASTGTIQLVTETSIHSHKEYGMTTIGSWSASFLATLVKDDLIELYLMNVTDASAITMESAQLWIERK